MELQNTSNISVIGWVIIAGIVAVLGIVTALLTVREPDPTDILDASERPHRNQRP
jgi:hypothetical protein